jgi:hypothetical protein
MVKNVWIAEGRDMFRWAIRWSVRWTALIFCLGCFGALLLAQAPKDPAAGDQAATEKSQAKDSAAAPALPSKESPASSGAASSANVPYPLDAIKNFSAIMIGSIAGDDEETHIYRLGRLVRTEIGGSYAVTDLTKGDTYGISPKGCLHDNHSAYRVFPFDVGGHGRTVVRVPSGKETVDGHSCAVEEVTVTATAPRAHTLKMRFWEAEDLQGFPIKVQVISSFGHDKFIRYKDVVLAPPDAALFKHSLHCDTIAPKNLPTIPAPAPKKAAPATPPAGSPQN